MVIFARYFNAGRVGFSVSLPGGNSTITAGGARIVFHDE